MNIPVKRLIQTLALTLHQPAANIQALRLPTREPTSQLTKVPTHMLIQANSPIMSPTVAALLDNWHSEAMNKLMIQPGHVSPNIGPRVHALGWLPAVVMQGLPANQSKIAPILKQTQDSHPNKTKTNSTGEQSRNQSTSPLSPFQHAHTANAPHLLLPTTILLSTEI
jgi:hypothetical protein